MKLLLVSEGASELGGSLQWLLSRLLGHEVIAETMKISAPVLRAGHGKGPRYFKKAIRCMLYAEQRGFDAVVVVIDQDDQPDRHKQFTDAQETQFTFFPRALGVAVRMFDAWMLADERALTLVLSTPVQKQPNPENMKSPKHICDQLRENVSFDGGMSEFYARLSGKIEIATLEQRCPLGFHPFAERVRQLGIAG